MKKMIRRVRQLLAIEDLWRNRLKRSVEVESQMLSIAKRGESAGPYQLRAWALRLGTPDDFNRRQP